jgi:hypothetical protein
VTVTLKEKPKKKKRKPRRRRSGGGAREPSFTGKVRASAVRTKKVWRAFDSDLRLNILWRVDSTGEYTAHWEVPLDAPKGRYRFVITGNKYSLTSSAFTVGPSQALTAVPVNAGAGRVAVELRYPAANARQSVGDPPGDFSADLTDRPDTASSGLATFVVDGRAQTVSENENGVFAVPVPAGSQIEVAAGSVRDQHGNANANALTLSP